MLSHMNFRNIFVLLALICLPGVIVPQINKDELYKTIQFLASKELAGVEYNEILSPEHFSVIMNGKTIQYQLGPDYVYRGFTGAGKLTAPVVFCGYGIDQPELGYNVYAGVDVKNKIVMVFRYNPKWNLNGKTFLNGNPREKAIVGAKHGALGILFVSFPNDLDTQKPIGSLINGKGEQMINFPEIHVGLNVADILFEGISHTLKELQTLIDSTKKPFPLSLNNKVDLEVHTKYQKDREVVIQI